MEPRVIELDACTLTFIEEDIAHCHFHDGATADKAQVQAMFDAMAKARGGAKSLFLVSFGQGATLTNDARAHASSPESSAYIAADAILLRDFGHQLSANAFVRVNRPQRPIQLFSDKDEAVTWLKQQRHLLAE
ncbi:MAG TPA: hypothetical protein PLA11_10645 [Flavobacteriales bacterium]|nr:hypothetical protein [Flavobacteriales bacterium]HOP43966.1 hypothetical protein [Flavobacteriales bacterium]HPF67698.1 hypothetical protein [Flavobacteriales bacterium]HPJ52249.1 hypothetical protein [Flavobacteriales bacterium]HPQ59043.1 hypothetical protein [Flavobacteriales bacterium]